MEDKMGIIHTVYNEAKFPTFEAPESVISCRAVNTNQGAAPRGMQER